MTRRTIFAWPWREVAATEESTATLRDKLKGGTKAYAGPSVVDLLATAGLAADGDAAAAAANDNPEGGAGGSGERERVLDGEQVQENEQEQVVPGRHCHCPLCHRHAF